jgi:hypothetical protein
MGISMGIRVAGSAGFLIGMPQNGQTGRLKIFFPVALVLMAVSLFKFSGYFAGPGKSIVMHEPEGQVFAVIEGPFCPDPAPMA